MRQYDEVFYDMHEKNKYALQGYQFRVKLYKEKCLLVITHEQFMPTREKIVLYSQYCSFYFSIHGFHLTNSIS